MEKTPLAKLIEKYGLKGVNLADTKLLKEKYGVSDEDMEVLTNQPASLPKVEMLTKEQKKIIEKYGLKGQDRSKDDVLEANGVPTEERVILLGLDVGPVGTPEEEVLSPEGESASVLPKGNEPKPEDETSPVETTAAVGEGKPEDETPKNYNNMKKAELIEELKAKGFEEGKDFDETTTNKAMVALLEG